MKLKNTHLTALTCASLLGASVASQAALTIGDIISVNLNSGTATVPSGAAVIGLSGDTWTNIDGGGTFGAAIPTTAYALNDTTGASSGVSMAFAGDAKAHGSANTDNLDVFEGGFFLDNFADQSSTITFSGLGAGTKIDLYLYAGGYQTGEGAVFTFGSTTQTVTNTVDIETAYTLGDNYVKFSGLVADGSGDITGDWTKTTDYSIFNGAQIEIIPEPSAALLGGLGMLCLLRRRRA